jgi:hypothetical protein
VSLLDLENGRKLDVSFLEAKSKNHRREGFFRKKRDVNLYNNRVIRCLVEYPWLNLPGGGKVSDIGELDRVVS